eukprot:403365944
MDNEKMTLNKSLKTEENQSFIEPTNTMNLEIGDQSPFLPMKQQTSSYFSPIVRRTLFQAFIFILTFCNYAVLHTTRAAWSNATPQIKTLYSFDSKLISYMNSSFLFCYAMMGIFSGHLADKYKKNRFIIIAYTLIGINVICVGCLQYINKDHQQIWLYFLLRIIDGTLQSIGWATNLAVLSNWFPKHGRGLLIGFWASNANVGDIIGAQIYKSVINADNTNWGTGIIIVGALVVVFGIINFLFLIEYPQSMGIVIQEESHLFQQVQQTTQEKQEQKSINFLDALLIPGVLIFSICFFFIKFSMYGFYYWLPDYIQFGLGYDKNTSVNIFSLFSTGSIVGNILMGTATDFLPYRSPVFLIGTALATALTLALTLWDNHAVAIISAFMFLLGGSLSGSTIVIAAIECDLGKQQALRNNSKALATVSGIIDGIAGFGSILGQILIGIVKDASGWRATFAMLTVATGLSCVPSAWFIVREYKEWKEKKAEESRKLKQSTLNQQCDL